MNFLEIAMIVSFQVTLEHDHSQRLESLDEGVSLGECSDSKLWDSRQTGRAPDELRMRLGWCPLAPPDDGRDDWRLKTLPLVLVLTDACCHP